MASRAKRANLAGGRLNTSTRRQAKGANSDFNGFIAIALNALMQRMREGAEVTEDVAERSIKAGNDAFKRLGGGLERHPLVLIAIAAGAGFLLGMARR